MFDRLRLRLASALVPKELGGDIVAAMFTQTAARTSVRRGIPELIMAYRTSPIFRSVVSKVAASFAAVPWLIYAVADRRVIHPRARTVAEAVPGGKAIRERVIQEAYEPSLRRRLLGQIRQQQQLVEIVDHPMTDLLMQAIPNVMTGLKARKLTQTYLDIAGETFWVLKLGPTGVPIEYWPIPPSWVQRLPDPSRQTYVIQVQGSMLNIPAEQVIWFRDIDPADPYGRGSGIGLSLGDELESDEYAASMVKSFFLNRGKPELLIGVKGISREEAKAAKEEFEREHRGFWRAHRSWWHKGDVTVQELQQKFTDMELVELRKWERDSVVSTYGVPPEIMGLPGTNSWSRSVARQIFIEEVLIPRLEDMRAELQMRLAPMFDERLIIDYEPPQADNKEMRVEVLKAMPWMASRGEIREDFLNLPHRGTIDDVHFVPAMMIPQRVPQEPEELPELLLNPPGVRGVLPAKTVKQPTMADVDNALEALRPERLTRELRPMWSEEFREWGERMTGELGLDPAAFDMLNPLVAEHLNDLYTNRIADIDQTTLKQLRETLTEGVRAGEDIRRLSARVEDKFEDAKGYRSRAIARTEVGRSSNAATHSAHKQSGIVEARQWVATLDDRTRDAHMDLNGLIVGIDQPFATDYGEAMYPGEFGVAEMDINCRCTTVAVIGPPLEEEALGAVWRSTEAERRPWDTLARRAFARGFAAQEKDVLAALEAAA